MSAGVVSGVAAAQQQNQIANAVKAFGTVVTVEPDEFLKIAGLQTQPLIAVAEGGFFKTTHQYLTSYKGLAFFTKSPTPLTLQPDAQVIKAASIKVPD